MGDISQSRYSIVERLTTQKLEVMETKQKIESDIEAKRLQVKQLKQNLVKKKHELDEDLNRYKEDIEQTIDLLEQEIAGSEKTKTSKSALCDAKIKELDAALKSIATISAASSEEKA